MTNINISKIMHLIVVIISFVVLFTTVYNITNLHKSFNPVTNVEDISEMLLTNLEFKEFKTQNNIISIQQIRKENIEKLNDQLKSWNVKVDEKFIGKYFFIYKDGFGIYDLYKNRIIYINNNYKFEIK